MHQFRHVARPVRPIVPQLIDAHDAVVVRHKDLAIIPVRQTGRAICQPKVLMADADGWIVDNLGHRMHNRVAGIVHSTQLVGQRTPVRRCLGKGPVTPGDVTPIQLPAKIVVDEECVDDLAASVDIVGQPIAHAIRRHTAPTPQQIIAHDNHVVGR